MCSPRRESPASSDGAPARRRTPLRGLVPPGPVPLPLALAVVPLLPTWLYVNRGYTVWFHLLSVAYLLTRSTSLRSVLILQGAAVCAGWYCAMLLDGSFDLLYRNMPGALLPHMLVEDGDGSYVALDGHASLLARALSHALDFVGHPGLAYLLWRSHRMSGGTLEGVLSWSTILTAWHLSRFYSLFHGWYNKGETSLWYYGHDVYVMSDLGAWTAAYVAEGATFAAAAWCRIRWDARDAAGGSREVAPEETSDSKVVGKEEGAVPGLVHSESAASAASMT